MGLMSRRPILPAPTDSLLGSTDDTWLGTDVGTDLSRRTDKTSDTIPDDGTPLTITTAHPRKTSGKLTKVAQQSQTSLLIEYFEGGKGDESGQRRPSLRVRYTPSHSRKSKNKGEGHVLVTEPKSARRPSQSHRIVLGGNETLAENIVSGSISSLDPADDLGHRAPVEIDVVQDDGSDLSRRTGSPEPRYIIPGSDISSMPAESSLGPNQPVAMSQSNQGGNLVKGLPFEGATLKPPIIVADRNSSNERITQKVIEKLSNKPRVSSSGKRHHSSRSVSQGSIGREAEVASPEVRTRVTKTVDNDSVPSATGSSLVSGSHLSADLRPTDQRSVRSGTSNVSFTNNPKLLQTVEDAIKRLILPQLDELKRDQRHSHRSRYEKSSNPSEVSSSTVSREDRARRKSSGGKSSRRVSRELDPGMPSGSARRHKHHKTVDTDSPSDQSYYQSESIESNSVRDEKNSRTHKSHRARDIAAGAIGGAALTTAALKSHDSASSIEYPEHRRRRRSKSRSSRSASVAEKEDVFQKHRVPAMPFVSEIGTDLTRSSLQSSNDGGSATPTSREVRAVVRGSPLDLPSSASITPTRNPHDLQRGLGTHHGNFSEHDLSGHDLSARKDMAEDYEGDRSHEFEDADFAGHGFAALTDPERARAYERNLHQQHPIRRGLSPIQSVASYATTEPNRNSMMQARSSESLNSLKKQQRMDDQVSISSLSSAPSTDIPRSRRPHGISLENRSEIMAQYAGSPKGAQRNIGLQPALDEQHDKSEGFRDSPYIDKVTAGRHVGQPLGATAEYFDPPSEVESAVASLCEPSVLDGDHVYSPRLSQADSIGAPETQSPHYSQRNYLSRQSGSPLKRQISSHSQNERGVPAGVITMASPLQSPARSADQLHDSTTKPAHSIAPVSGDMTGGQTEHSPDSDITTNPSIIRGPIGGLAQGNTDHWPYDPTPPRSRGDLALPLVSREIGSAGTDLIPEALSINRDHDLDPKRDLYMEPQPLATPPGIKDEGYETGANARSPGLYSSGHGVRHENFTPDPAIESHSLRDDPFTAQRDQYISGLSHGLSPMYDSATGRGRDHIQSKDIVALMDHLTVRDAQRNARDTEILVSLVRSAAEMRNSFEDMKNFISTQDDIIMDTAERQHEKTQKIVGGPRPQPMPAPRPTQSAPSEEDMHSKRRNVFQRALRGLGAKNSQELQNIEGMLMRLLDEVEALRAMQSTAVTKEQPRSTSLTSADNARAPTDTGYEPEGQAGTSSTGDRSGFFSNNSSRQADYRNYSLHRDPGNRVSTVMEGDEEYDDYDDHLGGAAAGNIQVASHTPLDTPPRNDEARHIRGGSVPLKTPPRVHGQNIGSLSNENTPHLSTTEGSSRNKHKSFASAFIPKMVSRWSKTTASSADNHRTSTQRIRPYSELSHSGSELGEYEYEHDPQGDDRIRSNTSLQQAEYQDTENRPPSPLIPSQLSDNPKYQAHRNSLNLQHPQPRQGPTGRYQSRLESEAYLYSDQLSPTSQTSSQWDNPSGVPTSHGVGGAYGGHLSPVSNPAYSAEQDYPQDNRSHRTASSQGPPRPPKILSEEPLVPQRPPKVMMSPPPSNRQPTYVDHVAAARGGSPAFDKVG